MIIELDPKSGTPPLPEQIRDQIIIGVAVGDFVEGDVLIPIRELAMQLGISKGTVAKAYELLTRDGLVHSNRKGGTRIAGGQSAPALEAFLRDWDAAVGKLITAAIARGLPISTVRDRCLRAVDRFSHPNEETHDD